jgi:hypothetical protein
LIILLYSNRWYYLFNTYIIRYIYIPENSPNVNIVIFYCLLLINEHIDVYFYIFVIFYHIFIGNVVFNESNNIIYDYMNIIYIFTAYV